MLLRSASGYSSRSTLLRCRPPVRSRRRSTRLLRCVSSFASSLSDRLFEVAPQQLSRLRVRPHVEPVGARGERCVGNDMALRKLAEREALRLPLGWCLQHEVVAQTRQPEAFRVEIGRVNIVLSRRTGIDVELNRAALG